MAWADLPPFFRHARFNGHVRRLVEDKVGIPIWTSESADWRPKRRCVPITSRSKKRAIVTNPEILPMGRAASEAIAEEPPGMFRTATAMFYADQLLRCVARAPNYSANRAPLRSLVLTSCRRYRFTTARTHGIVTEPYRAGRFATYIADRVLRTRPRMWHRED